MLNYIVTLALLVLLGVPPANATIYWTDDFENHLTPNWNTSTCTGVFPGPLDGCNPGISTDFAVSGTHSLKATTPGTYMDRLFNASTQELWTRYYLRLSNFVTNQVAGQKIQYYATQNSVRSYPNFYSIIYPGGAVGHIGITAQGVWRNGQKTTANHYANAGSGALANGVTYCIEEHMKMSGPGQSNGVIEVWKDGTQILNYTTLELNGPDDINPVGCTINCNSASTTMTYIRPYSHEAVQGARYIDDLVVGNQRIGCGSLPPVDTQAPSIQLTAPAAGATVSGSTVSITATASDNVGVAGVQFKIGTQNIGAEDTSAPYAATLNSTLFANGAHTLTAVARDAAGNSTTSAARSITISNVTTPPVGVVGMVSNLSAAATGANSATLSFTEVTDGTGQPAKYDVRFSSSGALWGGAPSVAQGTCATPLAGTTVGATKTCTVLGLAPSTDYQFQLVPYRGTPNVDVVFGSLSNVAAARTSAGANVMPPAKPKNLRTQ
ncbi:MAG: Ig-like domain-containing protein [Chloroflexota bacterium]